MDIETVKIKADNEQGFVIINKSDFDDKTQELFGVVTKTATRNTATRKRTAK